MTSTFEKLPFDVILLFFTIVGAIHIIVVVVVVVELARHFNFVFSIQ
jgi:hypothetical protein